MALLSGNSEHAANIARALGLPERVKWFELRMAAGKAATVTACVYVEDDNTGKIVEELKNYELVER